MKTLINILSGSIAGAIFVLTPTVLSAIAAGYKEFGEFGIYTIIVLSVPYYFLNRADHENKKSETKKSF